MTYKVSNRSVKCGSCEERLTDYNAYLKHVTHMHGQKAPSEETVVDWTLITDEDTITKQGGKYLVGSEAINWSPHFDMEAKEFLEEKYQNDLSSKKIHDAQKFMKAQEAGTDQYYDSLLTKISNTGANSGIIVKNNKSKYNNSSDYNKLHPNEAQRFPQNFLFDKPDSPSSFNALGTDVKVGYKDDPNAEIGSQTKRFSKGGDHGLEYPHNIGEPVAKEKFSTSFYTESDSD